MFQTSTLDESPHLLVRLFCKNNCKNLDAISAVCSMRFAANNAVEQEVIAAAIINAFL